MDSKRLIIFIALSFSILLGWQEFFAPKPVAKPATSQQAATAASTSDTPNAPVAAQPADNNGLVRGQRITVTTDLMRAEIDTTGGDLRTLQLLKHNATVDASKPFELFTDKGNRLYVAQTGLVTTSNPALPTHKTVFTAEKAEYSLQGDKVEVKLTAPEANGVKVAKVYTFNKGSYVIDVRYDIENAGTTPLSNTSAYFRLLRDGKTPEGESSLAHTFTGPAVYTQDGKFQKVDFSDLDKGKAEYVKQTDNGWVAMVQHYFASAWLLNANDGSKVCATAQTCQFLLEPKNGMYSAATLVNVPTLAAGQKTSLTMPLFAGPLVYKDVVGITDGLDLAKDYGMVHIFASPLFWLLTKLHDMVQNWGWAIVLLTLIVKAAFYPLTAASYRSMAKMKVLAPRLENLKKQHGDDRMKFQQAVMEMYKTEKVNPLGGCLPMLVQIPVFIGLYWALFASVELRQASWMYINDLGRPDPYYILPIIMAVTMFAQTYLNPPPADPMQAKMMKIMPVAFSVMFFFFPAGLVLYWVVNNILSIAQQYYVNQTIEKSRKAALQS